MPPAEKLLWQQLQGKQLQEFKFRRQHSVDNYILDFYCSSAKLAIEVDGDSQFQSENLDYDKTRQKHIESHGIKVLRFLNNEIYEDLEGVLRKIKEHLKANHP